MALPWQPTDRRLVDRVRSGDTSAFDRLYESYGPAVLAFCRHLTGSREDAEDALQHTFLAAYRRITESEDRLDLRPWLFAVARNRCLELLRARKRGGGVPLEQAEQAVDGITAQIERRDELRQLVRDLLALPEAQRAALVLSQLQAMPYREIGQVLGVSPEKVKSLVFQARTTLAATRDARDAPCVDIRRQLATARGASLRRGSLRRHVRHCSGCRDYEAVIRHQRRDLGLLLPAGLGTASTSGGLAVGSLGTKSLAGGGLGGVLAAVGGQTAVKLAVVVVVAVGGGTAGLVTANRPGESHGVAANAAGAAPSRLSTDHDGSGQELLALEPPAGGRRRAESLARSDRGARRVQTDEQRAAGERTRGNTTIDRGHAKGIEETYGSPGGDPAAGDAVPRTVEPHRPSPSEPAGSDHGSAPDHAEDEDEDEAEVGEEPGGGGDEKGHGHGKADEGKAGDVATPVAAPSPAPAGPAPPGRGNAGGNGNGNDNAGGKGNAPASPGNGNRGGQGNGKSKNG